MSTAPSQPASPNLLEGKTFLITGVVTKQSIAWQVARSVVAHGGRVVLTVYRGIPLVRRFAEELGDACVGLLELDVRNDDHCANVVQWLTDHGVHLDGVLHAIAFAPPEAMGEGFDAVAWESASEAFHSSVHTLPRLVHVLRPRMSARCSVIALSFDSRFAWTGYSWMGVAKAGLESTARYLAAQLGGEGIDVNIVSAGPIRTMAAMSVPSDSDDYFQDWGRRAPLGWDADDATPVGEACAALFSGLFRSTTGSIVYVDGGAHAAVE